MPPKAPSCMCDPAVDHPGKKSTTSVRPTGLSMQAMSALSAMKTRYRMLAACRRAPLASMPSPPKRDAEFHDRTIKGRQHAATNP